MKLRLTRLSFLLFWSSFTYLQNGWAQTDTFSEKIEQSAVSPNPGSISSKEKPGDFGSAYTFLVGPRINYIQGKYGFLGCSGAFMWHDINYIMESHVGFSVGMDLRLTKSMVYAPKITCEYRYFVFIARAGYAYFSDFKSDFEHRISSEIGLSLFGFLDITYLHSFGSKRNPFQLNNNYLNVAVTVPLNL